MEFLLKPWPWYVAGPLIGLMPALLLYIANKSFGISSSLRQICACVAPCKIPFLQYDWKKDQWNLYFVAGLVLGGFLAKMFLTPETYQLVLHQDVISEIRDLGISFTGGLMPDEFSKWAFLSSAKVWSIITLGGFMVGFGARYAGGCTSGHAITGLANFQWASLVSVIGFFAGGLAMTYFILPYWPF